MILVDSSVWIDYFRGTTTPQAEKLDALLGNEPIATGDLILAEVLQGFVSNRDFNQARKLMTSLVIVDFGGAGDSHSVRQELSCAASARNYGA